MPVRQWLGALVPFLLDLTSMQDPLFDMSVKGDLI